MLPPFCLGETGNVKDQFDLVKFLTGVKVTLPLQQFVAISPHHRRRLAISLSTREKKKKSEAKENVQTVHVATEVKRDQPTIDVSLNGFVIHGALMDHGAATNIMLEEVASEIAIQPCMLSKTKVVCKGVNQQPLIVLGKAEGVRIICGHVAVVMSIMVIKLTDNPYPLILGQPWMECVGAHMICRRGVLQLGPPGARSEIPLYPPAQMKAWCKQSNMEVVTPGEAVLGRHMPKQQIEIHQLREDEVTEESDTESQDRYAGYSTNYEAEESGSETEASMVMQVSIAPEQAVESFAAADYPTKDLEFAAADGSMKVAKVGADLSEDFCSQLVTLFSKYENLFLSNMLQMPQTNLRTHKIVLKDKAKPVQQMLRRIKPQHMQAVKEEIQELLAAKCIFPVQFAEWVSPLVIVVKKTGKVRVCIDYRKLNQATCKDVFPIPFIDGILDEVAGHEMLIKGKP